jgi:Asp-tRNA(Asn)/Glu-tRNA(Gln) amidotransferase C subunit
MAAIITFVERINELDTTGIDPPPTARPCHRTRPDELIPSPATPEEILALAPDRTEDCIRVRGARIT